MADIFTKKKRGQIMASISGKETKPEIIIRKYLFAQGFRFRKNVRTLLGKPDIVLPKYKTIIFVHGCFWHGHSCNRGKIPTTNAEFWRAKIQSNIKRDRKVIRELKKSGWKIIIVWDCKLSSKTKSEKTLSQIESKISSK